MVLSVPAPLTFGPWHGAAGKVPDPRESRQMRFSPAPRPLFLHADKISSFSSRRQKKEGKGKANTSAFVQGDKGRSLLRWNLFCAR